MTDKVGADNLARAILVELFPVMDVNNPEHLPGIQMVSEMIANAFAAVREETIQELINDETGGMVADNYLQQRMKPLVEALKTTRKVVDAAIYTEDGIDGSDGEAVLEIIDAALKAVEGK